MAEEFSPAPTRKNVAITGISGYIGSRLLAGLSKMPEIIQISGIVISNQTVTSKKLNFYQLDILEPLDGILKKNNIDTVIHLAFILRPTHKKKMADQVDVRGTINLLESCHKAKIKYLFYLSSHTVYGAFPDNPAPIKEGRKTRPLPGLQYSEDKVKVERLLLEFCKEHPETQLTILRVCPVIGVHAADTISTVMMKTPVMLRIRGYDPPMQFVQEDDLVELVTRLIVKPVPGIYNVASDGEIKYSEIAKLAGKKMLVFPEKLIHPLLSLSWKLHLQSQSPAIGIEFIKYPPLISTETLKNDVKFRFRYSSKEAVATYLIKAKNQ
jgi:UDP-glucose 4-epimerase